MRSHSCSPFLAHPSDSPARPRQLRPAYSPHMAQIWTANDDSRTVDSQINRPPLASRSTTQTYHSDRRRLPSTDSHLNLDGAGVDEQSGGRLIHHVWKEYPKPSDQGGFSLLGPGKMNPAAVCPLPKSPHPFGPLSGECPLALVFCMFPSDLGHQPYAPVWVLQ